jgi:hypothetical protein
MAERRQRKVDGVRSWLGRPASVTQVSVPQHLKRRYIFWPLVLLGLFVLWLLWSYLPKPPPPPSLPGGSGDSEPPPALSSEKEQDLLRQYEPELRFDPDEYWRPVPIGTFLRDAHVQRLVSGRWVDEDNAPTDDTLPRGNRDRLDLPACVSREGAECYENLADSLGDSPHVMYGRFWRNESGENGDLGYVLQYWLFYYFDDWRNAGKRPTMWQLHEGDWELIAVALSPKEDPVFAAYSRHCAQGGRRRSWDELEHPLGDHPRAFVARGSHANYFQPGSYPSEKRCLPSQAYRLTRTYHLTDVTGFAWQSGPPETAHPIEVQILHDTDRWLTFGGSWGERGYFRYQSFNNRWHSFDAGPGPSGPATKGSMWRNPAAAMLAYPVEQPR